MRSFDPDERCRRTDVGEGRRKIPASLGRTLPRPPQAISRGAGHEQRRQVPVQRNARLPHHHRLAVESRLVAEPAQSQDPAPALGEVRSHGRALRLRRGIREARPGCAQEGSPRADDRFAGLVAGRLGPLRRAVHPHGLATARAPTGSRTGAAAAAPATSASRRSTAGPTTATSTRRAGCCGRSRGSTATASPGPT